MNTISIRRRLPLQLATIVPVMLVGLVTGCGLFSGPSESVARIDSIAVASTPTQNGYVRLTFSGVLGGGCAELGRVERRAASDTLTWRFIARTEGSNCVQPIATLEYIDSVPNLPARTVVIRAERLNGEPPLRTLQLPLADTTQR